MLDPAARKHGPSRDATARLERLARGEAPPAATSGRSNQPQRLETSPAPLDERARGLEGRLRDAGVEALAFEEVRGPAFDALRAHGRAERVASLAYHADTLAEVERRVREIVAAEGAITLARLRDDLDTSRKYAQALLEHLDAKRVTRRRDDDARVLRGR